LDHAREAKGLGNAEQVVSMGSRLSRDSATDAHEEKDGGNKRVEFQDRIPIAPRAAGPERLLDQGVGEP
jgi:hypothetical protein